MAIEVDLSAPRRRARQVGAWSATPLDPGKTYTLATNDFMARGGDGYRHARDAPRIIDERDGPCSPPSSMAAIRKRGGIDAKVEGRIDIGG